MDRRRSFDFTRIFGMALVLGLFAWSLSFHRDAVAAMEANDPVEPVGRLGEETVETLELADDEVPEYLAFTVGLASGAYNIADLPGSSDRDYTVRESRSTSPADSAAVSGSASESVSDAFANYVAPEQGSLNPGLYGTAFGVEGCSFELRRVMRTKTEKVVGQEYLREGRLLVTINEIEPDRFISAPRCGEWVPWSPVLEPLETAGNGDYWIGDLRSGTWDVPNGCIWEKVVGFRGASLWDVQDSARSPEPLVVNRETLGVRIRGCSEPLTLQ